MRRKTLRNLLKNLDPMVVTMLTTMTYSFEMCSMREDIPGFEQLCVALLEPWDLVAGGVVVNWWDSVVAFASPRQPEDMTAEHLEGWMHSLG